MSKAFVESLKELGRLILLATVSWFLAGGIDAILTLLFGTKISVEMRLTISGLLTTILKAIDKYLHEKAPVGESGGLTRF